MLVLLLGLMLVAPSLGARLPYIIGGTAVTDATKWPWQGSLEYHEQHKCGVVLISSTWAATAAHCLYPINTLKVRFGSTKRTSGGQLVSLTAAITHEKWGEGSGSFPNDVAVIQFASLTLGDTIQPIALSTTEQAGNKDCYITGWGYTEVEALYSEELYRTLPEDLHEAKINVLTNDACKLKWEGRINDGHVCVGDIANNRGACNGDSGGPLACKVSGKWELVGLTSWGLATCKTNRPSVYSRISFFKSWIEDKTKQ